MPLMPNTPHRRGAAAILCGLLLGLAACSGPAGPDTAARNAAGDVPVPAVEGPLTGGIRTGQPFATSLLPLENGYVEEEFLISGVARGHGPATGSEADYVSRILVRRPQDPGAFNGTVVMHWNNVTSQQDVEAVWIEAAETIMRRGYIYVGVSAQKVGVDGSPLALAFWDPVRYPTVSHPGDDYAYDIFSQATQAVRRVPLVLGEATQARIDVLLASGSSQSGAFLATYINELHDQTRLFDGYLPIMLGDAMRDDVAPILAVNSQDEAGASFTQPLTQPDSGQFRHWEIAGPAHLTHFGGLYILAQSTYHYGSVAGQGQINALDPDSMREYGEQSLGGLCLYSNRFPRGHIWSAALVRLDEWVRGAPAPATVARVERDATGRLVFDEHGNAVGGLRHPVVDVPIASYYAGHETGPESPCSAGGNLPLFGTTQTFTYTKLAELYPAQEDYLDALDAAIRRALVAGHLLDEHASDLRRRARATNLYGPLGGLVSPR